MQNRFGTRAFQIRHQAGEELKSATPRSTFENINTLRYYEKANYSPPRRADERGRDGTEVITRIDRNLIEFTEIE